MKTGILLLNLGTPNSPHPRDVRRFLREFLSDPKVIDLPWAVRSLLLYGIILPFRPRKTAQAYQAIWTEDGSPLLVHSLLQKKRLADVLGDNYVVALGMRYGNPSTESAISQLIAAGCETMVIFPLFPQYALSATASAIDHALYFLSRHRSTMPYKIIEDFYDHPAYIGALAHRIQTHVDPDPEIFHLFSYHGLPVRQVEKTEAKHFTACDKIHPCPVISESNRYCYRAQAYTTARQLAAKLDLNPTLYQVSFQSRLGRTPWIQPYTDHTLPKLIEKGIRKLAITCPSFTVDCLETLEEIGIRARHQWQTLGGTSFNLIPCLNDDPAWIEAMKVMIVK